MDVPEKFSPFVRWTARVYLRRCRAVVVRGDEARRVEREAKVTA